MAVKVEEEKCIGCKLCIYTCPESNVIKLTVGKKAVINPLRCKSCLLCISVCPKKAIIKEDDQQ